MSTTTTRRESSSRKRLCSLPAAGLTHREEEGQGVTPISDPQQGWILTVTTSPPTIFSLNIEMKLIQRFKSVRFTSRCDWRYSSLASSLVHGGRALNFSGAITGGWGGGHVRRFSTSLQQKKNVQEAVSWSSDETDLAASAEWSRCCCLARTRCDLLLLLINCRQKWLSWEIFRVFEPQDERLPRNAAASPLGIAGQAPLSIWLSLTASVANSL